MVSFETVGNATLIVYDNNIPYYEIKSHYRMLANIEPVNFDIAIGNRNYLDEIERTFKFKIPGRKSEQLNIDVRGTQVTDNTLKNDLADIIVEELSKITPMYTKINKVKWDGVTVDVDTLTGREVTISTVDTTVDSKGGSY